MPANEAVAPPASNDTGNPLRPADKSEVPVPPADQPPDVVPPKVPETPDAALPPHGAATPPATPDGKPAGGEKPAVASVAGPAPKGAEPKLPRDNPAVGSTPAKPSGELAKLDVNPLSGALSKSNTTQPAVGPARRPPLAEDQKKTGRFMSDGQDVLLKFEAQDNAGWRRVLPEEFLVSRQPLLALPSYRSRVVVLNVDAALELINGTRIELLPDNAQGQPGVNIDFGRMVIRPLAHEGARLRVVVGSRKGAILLTSEDSIAGLEVTRVHEPGTDPEKVFSHALAKLYVARGGAVWEDAEGKPPLRLAAPAELMLAGAVTDRPSGAVQEMPKWITVNTVNELDQRAALQRLAGPGPQPRRKPRPEGIGRSPGTPQRKPLAGHPLPGLSGTVRSHDGRSEQCRLPSPVARLLREAQGSDRPRSGNGGGHPPVVGEGIRQRFAGLVPDAVGLYGQGPCGRRGCPAGQVSRPRSPGFPCDGL